MPHTKVIRHFQKPRAAIKGPVGRYIIRIDEPEGLEIGSETNTPRNPTVRLKGSISAINPVASHILRLKRSKKNKMRQVNIEFKGMDTDRSSAGDKDHLPPLTTTLTFSDYLCKWCLTYVGQRRQFCSADCASQFKICQKRRDQKQNLNISVDYYGNVKLSIQGLPISANEHAEDGAIGTTFPAISQNTGAGGRHKRRRKRCRNCAKLLMDVEEEEFCDESCQEMFIDRTKKDDFVNIFQQKEAAERRRIRKWLTDAQDQYTKQVGDGYSGPEGADITSGPAALNPLPVTRTPIPPIPSVVPPIQIPNTESIKRPKESARSLGHGYPFRRIQHVPESTFRLHRDEVVTGGPVTLNPIPLRKGPIRPTRRDLEIDPDKRQLMIDLKWIPKFNI
ncbi:uncharacterized protein LOC132744981 isoform X1 [Ruditapes philippinarum]|uniref:uncharacterized protein LOC132744981 isoform X1 n=2 Tax=Ruditapes philippinarum TaxID=129788 RepID=UPI00295BDC20|nr:uncharacterized protein LOC132744981 isoform X1 [Ruditapes philippinarum]